MIANLEKRRARGWTVLAGATHLADRR